MERSETQIEPQTGWKILNFREIWQHRDLIFLLARRDFVTKYKQTLLGPVWAVLQPVLTTLIFTVVFGNIARIPTEGVPAFLFYFAGNVMWGYFSTTFGATANTFVQNHGIFGKVYFPRACAPIATALTNLFQLLVQLLTYAAFLIYFAMHEGVDLSKAEYWRIPVHIGQMLILSLGLGNLISSLVTRYRDLSLMLPLLIQLWLYASPVVYPLSQVPAAYRTLYSLNPAVGFVEGFRAATLGAGGISAEELAISWTVTIGVFIVGGYMFHRVEKTFMDTV